MHMHYILEITAGTILETATVHAQKRVFLEKHEEHPTERMSLQEIRGVWKSGAAEDSDKPISSGTLCSLKCVADLSVH